jgi:hypothetical protein
LRETRQDRFFCRARYAGLKQGNAMQETTLSSAWTFWAKFVFPVVMLGFGLGTTIIIWSNDLIDRNGAIPPPQVKFGFLSFLIAAMTLILWTSAGLKRVHMDERQLYVSNYVREIAVPFSAITDVRQNRWLNSRPVTIYFREATEFGDKATFMPKQRIQFWQFWRVDPVVNELRQLAALTE